MRHANIKWYIVWRKQGTYFQQILVFVFKLSLEIVIDEFWKFVFFLFYWTSPFKKSPWSCIIRLPRFFRSAKLCQAYYRLRKDLWFTCTFESVYVIFIQIIRRRPLECILRRHKDNGFVHAVFPLIDKSRAMRKRVLCHMRTTKAQISLRIRCSLPR